MEAKEKARWARILKVYGITPEQYAELDTGGCPICLRPWGGTVRACIDHDHVTGQIRGLLCIYCNRYVVGRNRDADRIRRVADYLCAELRGWVVPPKPKRKKRKRA
jgi:hypothetical protein